MDTAIALVAKEAAKLVSNRAIVKQANPFLRRAAIMGADALSGAAGWVAKSPLKRGLGTAAATGLGYDAYRASQATPQQLSNNIKDPLVHGNFGTQAATAATAPVQSLRAMFSDLPRAQPKTTTVPQSGMQPGSAKRLPDGNYSAQGMAPSLRIEPTHEMRGQEAAAQSQRAAAEEQLRKSQEAYKKLHELYGDAGLPLDNSGRDQTDAAMRGMSGQAPPQQQQQRPNDPWSNWTPPDGQNNWQPPQNPWQNWPGQQQEDPGRQQRMRNFDRIFGYR